MTISEIAKMAGVSSTAISRYLNGGSLSEEKRKKIKEIIEETGYVPSEYARTLRTKKSYQIGVIVPNISSSTVARIVSGISAVLYERGYHLLLANTDNDPKQELDYLEKIVPASKVRALRFCGGRLLVEANGCRCSTEIQVEGVSHIEIGLHRSHLIEALRQFKTEPRVRMKLNSSISPIILEADGRNDRAMILPVRLKAPAAA